MGLREDDERRRLADPYDSMHHDGLRPAARAAGLVAILTVITYVVVDPGQIFGFLILCVGGTLALVAFYFTRKWLKSK